MGRKKKEQEFAIQNLVYVLRNGENLECKIGITDNLNRRLSQLQTGCPHNLVIEHIFYHPHREMVKKIERVLHRYYEKQGKKVRSNGEWFNLTQKDINFLTSFKNINEIKEMINLILKEM